MISRRRSFESPAPFNRNNDMKKREPSLSEQLSEMTHDQRMAAMLRSLSVPGDYYALVAMTAIDIAKREVRELESGLEAILLLQKKPPENP